MPLSCASSSNLHSFSSPHPSSSPHPWPQPLVHSHLETSLLLPPTSGKQSLVCLPAILVTALPAPPLLILSETPSEPGTQPNKSTILGLTRSLLPADGPSSPAALSSTLAATGSKPPSPRSARPAEL